VFSDSTEAASFLRVSLPEALSRELDWPTLTLLDGGFIDEALRESESDLLYQVGHGSSQEPVLVYILLEHQSSPDVWMRFRLLKYCCRIWDQSFRDRPDQTQLSPILPLVFYQGKRRWQHSTEFADLFPEVARAWSFVPRFTHMLIDQSSLEPQAIQGGAKGRMLQLLMKAAFRQPLAEVLE
jgi:predicted transposase/invertase (TIGR01784 family)